MSIIDGIGNKIAPPKTEGVTKINTRSTNYPGVFGRPTRIPSDEKTIPNQQTEIEAQRNKIQTILTQKIHTKEEPRDQVAVSRGDESVGVESTYRFKGRGTDFQNGGFSPNTSSRQNTRQQNYYYANGGPQQMAATTGVPGVAGNKEMKPTKKYRGTMTH